MSTEEYQILHEKEEKRRKKGRKERERLEKKKERNKMGKQKAEEKLNKGCKATKDPTKSTRGIILRRYTTACLPSSTISAVNTSSPVVS